MSYCDLYPVIALTRGQVIYVCSPRGSGGSGGSVCRRQSATLLQPLPPTPRSLPNGQKLLQRGREYSYSVEIPGQLHSSWCYKKKILQLQFKTIKERSKKKRNDGGDIFFFLHLCLFLAVSLNKLLDWVDAPPVQRKQTQLCCLHEPYFNTYGNGTILTVTFKWKLIISNLFYSCKQFWCYIFWLVILLLCSPVVTWGVCYYQPPNIIHQSRK